MVAFECHDFTAERGAYIRAPLLTTYYVDMLRAARAGVGVRVGEAMAQACVCGSYIRTLFLNLSFEASVHEG